MIFNNLKLSDPFPELGFFLWQIVGRALPNSFDFIYRWKRLKGNSLSGILLPC